MLTVVEWKGVVRLSRGIDFGSCSGDILSWQTNCPSKSPAFGLWLCLVTRNCPRGACFVDVATVVVILFVIS